MSPSPGETLDPYREVFRHILSWQYQQSQSAGVPGKSLQFWLQSHASHEGSRCRGSGRASGPGVIRGAGVPPGTTGVTGVVTGDSPTPAGVAGPVVPVPPGSGNELHPATASTRNTPAQTRRPCMKRAYTVGREKDRGFW